MKPYPTEILADWLESLPAGAGPILVYRLTGLLPPSEALINKDTPEAVTAMAVWLRASSRGLMKPAGLALSMAALIDYCLVHASWNRMDPQLLMETPHQQQRAFFGEAQTRQVREAWATLRRGTLSPEGVDRWLNEMLNEALDPLTEPILRDLLDPK